MTEYKKQIIRIPQGDSTRTFKDGSKIDDMIAWLQEEKAKGSDRIFVLTGWENEMPNYFNIGTEGYREETDEEFERRVAGEERRKRESEESERNQLEYLKRKYEQGK